jgi:hypothetical protein
MHGLGDFVAFGMGMSTSSETSSSISSGTSTDTFPSTSFPTSNASSGHTGSDNSTDHASVIGTGFSRTPQDLKSRPSSEQGDESVASTTRASKGLAFASANFTDASYTGTAVRPKPTNTTASATGFIPDNPNPYPTDPPILYNQSYTLTGDCWNQWSQYWSAVSLATSENWYHYEFTTTFTTTESSVWWSTSTVPSFYTTTESAGQFLVATYTTTAPVTEYDLLGSATTTWTTTETTSDLTLLSIMPNMSLAVPSCVLPSLVPQCQASWERYINHMTDPEDLPFNIDGPTGCDAFATTTIPMSCQEPISTWASVRSSYFANEPREPDCSQAKVPEDWCSSTRAQFIYKKEGKADQSNGVPIIDWSSTTINGTATSVPYWPYNSTIGGPGCTLGCGSCAMQGGTVELIYWPPATTAANASIHGPVTVEALGTTFTSPTVSPPSWIS